MIGPWRISDADRRLIPSSGLKGPVPLLFAIMLFVMTVAAGTGLAIGNLSSRVSSGITHRYSVQINDGQAQGDKLLTQLRASPAVQQADPVSEADLRKMLEQWLGPASRDPQLPIPMIIDVDLKPGASPQAVTRMVTTVSPGATFRSYGDVLKPMLRALGWLGWLSLSLVILIGAATCAAVIMAARGALDSHRATIEVMHGIGATDRQISRIFLRQIAGEALLGGLIGTIAAIVVGIALSLGNGMSSMMAGPSLLGWTDAVLVALLPIIATMVATFVARRALMGTLGERL